MQRGRKGIIKKTNSKCNLLSVLLIAVLFAVFFASCQTVPPQSAQQPEAEQVQVDIPEEPKEPEVQLELYTGNIYSLFIHPLIAYEPMVELSQTLIEYADDWFVTSDEFRAVLRELHKNNFILIKTSDVYHYDEQTKIVSPKPLYLPAGKKPVLLSADDLNYYPNMKRIGTAHRLIVGEDGKIYTQTTLRNGSTDISRDAEFVTIVEDFIQEHPDFSHNGAKGVIALTGYNGTYGYPTHKLNDANYKKNLATTQHISKVLKQNGWELASHSYDHLDFTSEPLAVAQKDFDLWEQTVEPITGKTQLFIYPFGAEPSPANLQELIDRGFVYLYGVGIGKNTTFNTTHVLSRRRQLDGVYFGSEDALQSKFFDIHKVTDRYRR